jgi:hypothetical protein
MADEHGRTPDPLCSKGSGVFQVLLVCLLMVLSCLGAEGLAWLLLKALYVAESVAGYHPR